MKKTKKIARLSLLGVSIVLLILGGIFVSKSPSHDREWDTEHAVLPHVEIEGNTATVYDIRNFSYKEDQTPMIQYYDRTISLNNIEGVDFIVSYFSEYKGIAHTFLTFRIKNSDPIAISIEARREKGEEYSPVKGLFRNYEEIYVVGDERDLIGIRTNIRNEEVYIFPGNTTPEKAKALFLSMLERINHIYDTPEFYNTLTNQCTNKIARHIASITEKEVPFSYKLLLPGYSDEYAYDLGFIGKPPQTLEELKEAHKISPENTPLNPSSFSKMIRRP